MTYKELYSTYTKLNNSFKKIFVFHIGVNAGFFSEYNNMVLAVLYCLKHKIKFMLYSDDANFKIKKGYTDIFEQFCEEIHDSRLSRLNFRWYNKSRRHLKKEVELLKNELGIEYFTQDLWGKFCTNFTQYNHFNIPELEIKGTTQEAAQQILKLLWKFNPKIQNQIDEHISQVSIHSPYTGFHIRGGDKIIEADVISGNDYIDKAISDGTPKNAFVLTDNYRIFESLCNKYPEWHFSTLCQKEEHGYFYKEYMNLNDEEKFSRLINLLSSVEILSNSVRFYGTYTSNPGMFLGMRMSKKNMVGLDRKTWITRW